MSAFPSTATAKRPQEALQRKGPGVSTTSRLFQSPETRTLLLCLLLIGSVLVSYNSVVRNGFINYDDDGYIVDNPHVKAGITWATVKWAFTTYDKANWHPLTWLSHALDCQLFGLNPAGHHYMSVQLHAANAVLLFLLLQSATGFQWRSLMVAALFALHPINVESVAWAAERKNVFSMLFFLLALFSYGWYARRAGPGRYMLVVFFFALSLLSKPQAIVLPFLLLLWDYWPLCRWSPQRSSNIWLVAEKIPLLLLSTASALITVRAQRAGGAVKPFSQYSPLLRLETAIVSYLRYLGKAFWPAHLVALYPHPANLYPSWKVGGATLLLVIVTALVIIRRRDQRYLYVGWFWFLGSLVPMIGLVQVGSQAMADRYAYIPFIGLFILSTWLIADWAHSHGISTKWLIIPAVSGLLVLGNLTYRQVGYWRDTESFWLRTLALTHNNYVAEDNLAEFLNSQGRTEEAVAHYRAALAIRPDDLLANMNVGNYEHGRGNLPAAIERYQVAAKQAAKITNVAGVRFRAVAYVNLGYAYRQSGESALAKQSFGKALQLEPDQTTAMIGLGLIAQKNGDLPEAIRQYSRAAAAQSSDVGHLLLAQALQQEGHSEEARAIYERVARSPNVLQAQKEAQALLSGK